MVLKSLEKWGGMLAFVFVMCGACRWARFNITSKPTPRGPFEGLPIPAAAALLVSYTMFCLDVWGEVRLVRFLVVMVLVTSGLMVSSIPYENRPSSWRNPIDRFKFIFIFVGVVAVLIDLSKTLFPLVFLYVLSGVLREMYRLIRSGTRRPPRRAENPSGA